jgi:hypothetical protein
VRVTVRPGRDTVPAVGDCASTMSFGWLEVCFLIATSKCFFSSVRLAALIFIPTTFGTRGNGFATVRLNVEPVGSAVPQQGLPTRPCPLVPRSIPFRQLPGTRTAPLGSLPW